MKKIIILLICFVMISAISVTADVDIEVVDTASDKVRVSGEATLGSYASVMITNPGYSYEQAISAVDGSVQYFDGMRVGTDGYFFDISLNGNIGGEFGVYVDVDGVLEKLDFTYYTSSFKLDVIKALNNAKSTSDLKDLLENSMGVFGFSDDDLFLKGNLSKIAESIIEIRNGLEGRVFSEDVINLNETSEHIFDALILAAFNAGKEELVTEDGMLKFINIIGIEDCDEYVDYCINLSPDGIKNTNKGMLGNDFSSLKDAEEKFCELVHYNVLMNNSEGGYGHIPVYFEKYRTFYEAAGFKIPTKNNRELYLDMLELKSDDLKSLAKDFNKLKVKDSGSSGGVQGGSSSAPRPSASNTNSMPVTYIPTDEVKQDTVSLLDNFTDITSSHWAYNFLDKLVSENILNGYSDNTFRPDANITRAEFASILQRAWNISGNGEKFLDVREDAWYYSAVSAMSAKGLINGFEKNFFPDRNITREDAAVIIYRFIGQSSDKQSDFIDSPVVSDYAKEAVNYLSNVGILSGYDDGYFRPKASITRAEAAKIIYMCITKEENR